MIRSDISGVNPPALSLSAARESSRIFVPRVVSGHRLPSKASSTGGHRRLHCVNQSHILMAYFHMLLAAGPTGAFPASTKMYALAERGRHRAPHFPGAKQAEPTRGHRRRLQPCASPSRSHGAIRRSSQVFRRRLEIRPYASDPLIALFCLGCAQMLVAQSHEQNFAIAGLGIASIISQCSRRACSKYPG